MAFFLAVLVAETVAPAGRRVLWGSHAGAKKHGANAPAISEMTRGGVSSAIGKGASFATASDAPTKRNGFAQDGTSASRFDADCPLDKAALARETVTLLLNLLIYGGGAIVALGAFSSLDRADSFAHVALVVAVCAACVAAIVFWRRHRVRSGVRFTMLSNVGVFVLFAALALVGLIPGLVVGSQVASDMVVGPRTEMCVLQEFAEHHPAGRLAGMQQDTFSLAFATQDGKEARVTVAEADRAALVGVTEVGSEVELTYYPHAGVLVSAKLM